MNYPKAEMIIRNAPLHVLVTVEPVTQELFDITTYIPDPDSIRTELECEGYGASVDDDLMYHLCEQVQERIDGQGCQGFAPAI